MIIYSQIFFITSGARWRIFARATDFENLCFLIKKRTFEDFTQTNLKNAPGKLCMPLTHHLKAQGFLFKMLTILDHHFTYRAPWRTPKFNFPEKWPISADSVGILQAALQHAPGNASFQVLLRRKVLGLAFRTVGVTHQEDAWRVFWGKFKFANMKSLQEILHLSYWQI